MQLNSVRQRAKQGNPIEKTGVVGAFCRTYDIYRAMEVFLPEVYIPCQTAQEDTPFQEAQLQEEQ